MNDETVRTIVTRAGRREGWTREQIAEVLDHLRIMWHYDLDGPPPQVAGSPLWGDCTGYMRMHYPV